MISAQLAKELKNTGWLFRQNARGDTIDIDGMMHCLPTLSELISAVDTDPNAAFILFRDKEGWHASYSNRKSNKDDTLGDTPETAVAKLWLTAQ